MTALVRDPRVETTLGRPIQMAVPTIVIVVVIVLVVLFVLGRGRI
jgi:hypothetical protein